MYEDAKKTVADFINAHTSEIVFVKNETEGANLVAFSFLKNFLKKGDTILLKAKVICACVDSNLKTKPIPAAELSKLKIV
jgi:cysteine sulfinate desulfinase/cysteine desulfurase-like protein